MKELQKKQFVKPELVKFEKSLDKVTLCWNRGSGYKDYDGKRGFDFWFK